MKNKIFKISKKNSGETLIEIIIAFGVIITVLAPAAGLQVQSIRNLAFSRDHLIAETLVNEGIEIIRNMRDTNFLKFPGKEKDCWNTKSDDPDITLDNCNKNKIESGSYILKRDIDTLKWSIKNISANFIPDDFNFEEKSEYQLKLDNNTQLYNHDSGGLTNFFREIYVEYDGGNKMNVFSACFLKTARKQKLLSALII
mgnify:FL=1